MKKRPTIQDVADRAGVSKVTVSYVLNGRAEEARIAPQTAERIANAALEIGYRPNANARSLKRQRADAIAVIFQYASTFAEPSAFVSELMSGVCEACVEADLDVILHTRPFDDPQKEIAALADGRTDGALILRDPDDPLVPLLLQSQLPTVFFFTRPLESEFPYVDVDNLTGGRMAAERLISLGRKRLGMMVGPAGSTAAQDRREGFFTAAPEALAFFEGDIGTWTIQNEIDGLFCWSDDFAFEAMRALKARKIELPRDVSIIGFDSTWACERSTPQLTSICQPIRSIARHAVQLLTEVISNPDLPHSSLVVPPTLDIRESCGAFKAEVQS